MRDKQPEAAKAPPAARLCFAHDGRRIDKDTPKEVEKTCHNEVRHKGMTAATQGCTLRACPFIRQSMKHAGNDSAASHMLHGTATNHTRKLCSNNEHKEHHNKHLNEPMPNLTPSTQQLIFETDTECNKQHQAENTRLRICPFCLTKDWQDREKLPGSGNARHLASHCTTDKRISNAREQFLHMLEEATDGCVTTLAKTMGGFCSTAERPDTLIA